MKTGLQWMLATAAAVSASGAVLAATDTADLAVRITIENACDVQSTPPTDLDFGTVGLLTSAVTQTSTITVTCTEDADYDIGLGAGLNPVTPGDTSTRRMADGVGNFVAYELFQPDGTSHWGDIIDTDTVASTGTGAAQTFTVNGNVPVQNTPPAGLYADTVLVTVTF